jgi:hypothetical protein
LQFRKFRAPYKTDCEPRSIASRPRRRDRPRRAVDAGAKLWPMSAAIRRRARPPGVLQLFSGAFGS